MTIFSNNCESCHNTNNAQGGISYITGQATDVAMMVSSGIVVPGQPGSSTLYGAVSGTQGQTLMPLAGMLSTADVQAISNWIASGTK